VRLRYTPRPAAELDEVLDYIAEHSPKGAAKVKRRMQTIIALLLRHPEMGQRTNRAQLRRIVAHPYPYLVFYQATPDEIIIHGVRHGARRPRRSREGRWLIAFLRCCSTVSCPRKSPLIWRDKKHSSKERRGNRNGHPPSLCCDRIPHEASRARRRSEN